VDRANFVKTVLGVQNVEFVLGDVRKLDVSRYGKFDLVLCSGILHHLGQSDFDDIIESLYRLTDDMLFIYLHISTDLSVTRHRLQGPVKTTKGYNGYLFREHKDTASQEEKYRQVRASLDNTFSFWPTEPSLYDALRNIGFKSISRLQHPHLFGWEESTYRPLVIARV
jgi:ubiquinone/menaquinone biosynthesis C-methylase UbiE